MSKRVDLFDSTYSHFTEEVMNVVRKETFGIDIGQNSWLTTDEYDRILPWLNLSYEHHVLEIASGSGGPALYLARKFKCNVTGIDNNENGVAAALQMSIKSGESHRVQFKVANANAKLDFADNSFNALLCMDSMNHFPDRLAILKEWHRVIRSGGRALFSDPVVITGPVTNDELALRSAIGLFLFVPPGINERLIKQAGFNLIKQEDISNNAALVAERWFNAREKHKEILFTIEGKEKFEGLQRFFGAVHSLTSRKCLSRIIYLAEK